MSFRDLQLNLLIQRNLAAMGYRSPRPIQAQAIGPIINGRDVIGLAPTGTGKTAAFVAPIAHHLLIQPPESGHGRKVDPARRLRALVLCPTRELAIQVAEEARQITAGTVLRVACAYGKVGLKPQAEIIARGIDLLVATPGRVRELMEAGALSLDAVRYVAIDEADRMLDMGFLPQVSAILAAAGAEQSSADDGRGRQIVLFTATMPEPIEELAGRFLTSPIRVEVGRHTTPAEHVEQHVVAVEQTDKVRLLLHMLGIGEKDEAAHGAGSQGGARHAVLRGAVLVFCRTRRRVGWVGTALQRRGLACGMVHGDRTQAQRLRALDGLASGKLRIIVATDVAARGLHIPAIRTVVNYDVPPDAEEYVHRIGRAGHGGGAGEAWTFLAPSEHDRWRLICRQINLSLTPEEVAGFVPSEPRPRGRLRENRGGGDGLSREAVRQGNPKIRGRRIRSRAKSRAPSRKSRPIPKGERPGAGVKRPPRPSDEG